jgi:hypothetical protein
MRKYILLIILLSSNFLHVHGQTQPAIPQVQPYGKIDKADLEMTICDFEKDANAEVLFNVGKMYDDHFEQHMRVKIFNNFGKGAATFRFPYASTVTDWGAKGLVGETFNLIDGKIEITPLDKSQIYIEKTNKFVSTIVFTFPNVKAGSIIEFKSRGYFGGTWYFQDNFPVRYSEIKTDFSPNANTSFKFVPHVKQPYAVSIGEMNDYDQTKALAYVPSLPNERFIRSRRSSYQSIEYTGSLNLYNTWSSLGDLLARIYDRDQNIDIHLPGEQDILQQAKALKSDDEKIAFIFDQVRDRMNWNKRTGFFAEQSTATAWTTNTGSSADINWIIFHLLKKAGLVAYPVITGDSETGELNPGISNSLKFSSMAVLVPIDSATNYVLDGTDKMNMYNTIPKNYLNIFGLEMNKEDQRYAMVFLEDPKPVIQQASVNAEIKPDGKLVGTMEIISDKYNKYAAEKNYAVLGEQKYIDSLRGKDNTLKVTYFKIENINVDSLALSQKISFSQELTGSDEQYIYFNTNLFSLMGDNPFISNSRYSDIDFGYRRDFSISGIYKVPDGYKVDALPKSITSFMPDRSIMFKRVVVQDKGTILVRYTIDHKKSLYFAKDYPDIKAFYKSMYDLLNEQIVLKKS